MPRTANSALVANETGWMSMSGRFKLLAVSFLVRLNGRAPARISAVTGRAQSKVLPERFVRRVFDASTTPAVLVAPWSTRQCTEFTAHTFWRFHCQRCRRQILQHSAAALRYCDSLVQQARTGTVPILPRDFSLSPWISHLALILNDLGLDWMDPSGPELPSNWRTCLRQAIFASDSSVVRSQLADSSTHLTLYRQLIRGSGEFFRWQSNVRRFGISDSDLLWWGKLRSGQLDDYGINDLFHGRPVRSCVACGAAPDSPEHFLLGDLCVNPLWHARRLRIARAFRSLLSRFVRLPVVAAYDVLPLKSRLLISLGASFPNVLDAELWPCWAGIIEAWRFFWGLRPVAALV
jgi:hypothetical protein